MYFAEAGAAARSGGPYVASLDVRNSGLKICIKARSDYKGEISFYKHSAKILSLFIAISDRASAQAEESGSPNENENQCKLRVANNCHHQRRLQMYCNIEYRGHKI